MGSDIRSTYVFQFITRCSRCNSSLRCCYRAREHVDMSTRPDAERSGTVEIATRDALVSG